MNVAVSFVLELLFLSQTLQNIFVWDILEMLLCVSGGRVVEVVWAGDGSDLSWWGGLMLWYPSIRMLI